MKPAGRHQNSVIKQCIPVEFRVVGIVMRSPLAINDFHGKGTKTKKKKIKIFYKKIKPISKTNTTNRNITKIFF